MTEAIKYAEMLEAEAARGEPITAYPAGALELAAELRRLHEVNKELIKALESLEMMAGIPAMQDDPVRVKARAVIRKAKGEKE